MGYMHIENLYRNRDILLFKEAYALEKIHGTSARVGWNGKVYFFSGGESHDLFIRLFDKEGLAVHFANLGAEKCCIYGEAYGGKCQGMRETYGNELRFVAFEVCINGRWLCVPEAEKIVASFGLDFVPYCKISTDIDTLEYWKNAPSQQSVKNGIIEERKREGVVLRPLIEVTKNNGQRVIVKHKNDDFSETKTKRSISDDADKLKVLTIASEIADEWVTPMRLTHVLQRFNGQMGLELIPQVMSAMIEDIEREGDGEVDFSKEARRQISRKTADLFKERIKQNLAIEPQGIR
jgi:hypothetical protein